MPRSRRTFLIAVAIVIAVCDMLFLAWHSRNPAKAFAVTYTGLDSLGVVVPASQRASALQSGKWVPDLAITQFPASTMGGQKRELFYITLAPTPTYSRFLASIRDLRSRGKCNVLIREGGRPMEPQDAAQREKQPEVEILALVLCGSSIGDAGFYGTLPPDRIVRLEANAIMGNGN